VLHTTKAIILKVTKYSENALVVQAYTELFGLQSYMINNVRGKKAKNKPAFFQPLSLVELVVYHKQKEGLQRLSEIKMDYTYVHIPFDFSRNGILLFLNEVIYKSIREEEANPDLYDFLNHALQALDELECNCNNFHLLFMLKLSNFLGFYPQQNYSADKPYFNLMEGYFQEDVPVHSHYLAKELSYILNKFLDANFSNFSEIEIYSAQRRQMLERLIEYFELHILHFKDIKSREVLEGIMS
jgi:DNA repair protein RecO (recombination protein O)